MESHIEAARRRRHARLVQRFLVSYLWRRRRSFWTGFTRRQLSSLLRTGRVR